VIPEVIIPLNTAFKVLIAGNTILPDLVEYKFLKSISIQGRWAFADILIDSVPGVNIIPYCILGVIYTGFLKHGLKPYLYQSTHSPGRVRQNKNNI